MVENAIHSQRIDDRFEIRDPEHDLLGRGSMGDVYRAADTLTGELVAVKALDPRIVARDPRILARFVREGEALRQLNHPNIVRVVVAVEEEGRPFLPFSTASLPQDLPLCAEPILLSSASAGCLQLISPFPPGFDALTESQ